MAVEKVWGTPFAFTTYSVAALTDYLPETTVAGAYAYQQVKVGISIQQHITVYGGEASALKTAIESQTDAEVVYIKISWNEEQTGFTTFSIADLAVGFVFRSKSDSLILGSVLDAARTVSWFNLLFTLCKMGEGTAVYKAYILQEAAPKPPPVVPVVLPSLPWYASWLTPVLQFLANPITAIIDSLVKANVTQGGQLDEIKGLRLELKKRDLPTRLFDQADPNNARNIVREAISGQLPFLTRLINPEEYFAPGTADNAIAAKFSVWWAEANVTTDLLDVAAWVAEAATLGQIEAAGKFVDSLLAIFPLEALMSKVSMAQLDAAWVKPIQRQVNAKWLPERPGVGDFTRMRARGIIAPDVYTDDLKGQGFAPEWSQRLWDAHFPAPDYASVREAYWRGLVKPEQLDEYLMRADVDPRFNDTIWKPLLEAIPGTGELVNERTKEVIDQAEFEKGLGWWGVKGKWAQRVWDAHFAPATWNDFLSAMRRKQTVSIPVAFGAPVTHTFGVDAAKDIDVIKGLSKLADYDERYWDFFRQRMYNDPSPRMSMWSYDIGVVSEEKLREIVHRYGYLPEDEKWYGDMLVHFQERPWVTKYLMALSSAYIEGAIDAAELKKRVLAIPRNEAVAEWMIKISDVRKEIDAHAPAAEKEKLLGIGDLRRLTVEGIMDMDVFRSELTARGYSYEDAEYLVQLIQLDRVAEVEGKKTVTLSVVEWLNAWRYNVITEDKLRIELSLRGLPQDELETLIALKKKQWTISPGGD
jgi:hypothetical protein